ncbi:hypothetical protein B0J13DRAFT_572426 [Dactylonectria estremocensis]|uniref:Secreted protein n=1 Tax=Dactylonectria estremocensis TaxID=1079267 RepID=A0A9P9ID45_9HYPO|nr:hypothetical protein B0J13DRAFT_572426 [Dactylonectria estremocensis]
MMNCINLFLHLIVLHSRGRCCLYCRVEGKPFEHAAKACSRRWYWINAKSKAWRTRKRKRYESG